MLKSILQDSEYECIPSNARDKIEAALTDSSEQYITLKALNQTLETNHERELEELKAELEDEKKRKESLVAAFKVNESDLKDLQQKFTAIEKENLLLKNESIKWENELRMLRLQRDEAEDEKVAIQNMLTRRDNELSILKSDYNNLNEKLKAAIVERVEALNELGEISSKKIELEYKEKRLDEDRQYLTERIETLQAAVCKHNEEMTCLKRQHNSTLSAAEVELAKKTEEVLILSKSEEELKRKIKTLGLEVEELNEKLSGQSDNEEKIRASFLKELECKDRINVLYKEMSEDSSKKVEELTQSATKLQTLLAESTEQITKLKEEYFRTTRESEEIIRKNNETINALREELEHANQLIETLKDRNLTETIADLSPHAAAACNMIKKGLTLTQIYVEYARISEELLITKQENTQLSSEINVILKELEAKAPILKKRQEDYIQAMRTVEELGENMIILQRSNEELEMKFKRTESQAGVYERENQRLKKSVADLGRQVCYLLKEVEESRGRRISMSPDNLSSGSENILTSDDVISKKLVTFQDIVELQETNQKLLDITRDLSKSYDDAMAQNKLLKRDDLEKKVEMLERLLMEKDETIDRSETIRNMMKNQAKMYQMVYNQQVAGNSQIVISTNEIGEVSSHTRVNVDTQTDESDSENNNQLKKELEATKKALEDCKSEYESNMKEHAVNEKMFIASLDEVEKKLTKAKEDNSTLAAKISALEEQLEAAKLSKKTLTAQITALESKCAAYGNTIEKNEQTIVMLRDQAMNSFAQVSRLEMELQTTKRECSRLRDAEARLSIEREILNKDKQNQQQLFINLESIKASIERSDCEWKTKMEEKLEVASMELSALRRRMQEEQDRYREGIKFSEKKEEVAKERLEEEKKVNNNLRNTINNLNQEINNKCKEIEELNERIRSTTSKSFIDLESEIENVTKNLTRKTEELNDLKEVLKKTKEDANQMKELSQDFEQQLLKVNENFQKYKEETEISSSEMAGEIAGLKGQKKNLEDKLSKLSDLEGSSMHKLNEQVFEWKKKYTSANEELKTIKSQLTTLQFNLKSITEEKLLVEKKYSEEVLQHTKDIKDLGEKTGRLIELESEISILKSERDSALEEARSKSYGWIDEQKSLKEEVEKQNDRMKELMEQNELLFNQIQDVSFKMSMSHLREGEGDSPNTSLVDIEGKSSERLLQVIGYLRKEKSITASQLEVFQAENMRLKSEVELYRTQLDQALHLLKTEREKSDVSITTTNKHAELMQKVETLSAITDSNRMLREEKENLSRDFADLSKKLTNLEKEVVIPLKEENRALQVQVDAINTEMLSMQKECNRWRIRVSELTERMNKAPSEDVVKSLQLERESHNKTLEDLRAVKQEKSKIEDQLVQMKKLHTSATERICSLEKERDNIAKELEEVKQKLSKLTEGLEEQQKTCALQETQINEMKSSTTQLRLIAKKYKKQYLELQKIVDEAEQIKEATAKEEAAKPAAVELSSEEQEKLRQEGRSQLESEIEIRLKNLNEQVLGKTEEIDELLKENRILKDSIIEKENRARDLMKNARNRILFLTTNSKKFQLESENFKSRMEKIETQTRDESIARQNVIKSSYENRISKVEKEKADLQVERDRLARDIDSLSQRVSTLQRQQIGKTGVSVGQEKSTTEPPTANIKPMAGPSTSKSPQGQQSVTVTPWRSASETPLASIRPMSMQSRTAAVLPTSQTSCNASQSTAMVPPQQQLVDTSCSTTNIMEAFSSSPSSSSSSSSSHTDYNLPSTSSAVSHTTIRQVAIAPTQQSPLSAESTQDIEGDYTSQDMQTQSSIHGSTQQQQISHSQQGPLVSLTATVSQSQAPTIALVLPRIESQGVAVAGPSHAMNLDHSMVSASNQTEQSRQPGKVECYYKRDDSKNSQVSASNQQSMVASSVEIPPEQSVVVASSHHSVTETNEQTVEPSAMGVTSNSNSSNTVTTTQAGLKRSRESIGEGSNTNENIQGTAQPQVKRTRLLTAGRSETFRDDFETNENEELRSSGLDVEYQVPTSSQRDQDFDNMLIDSEPDDELDEDQAMPDDGIIDEIDEEDGENGESYDIDRDEHNLLAVFNVAEDEDINQDQDNEVEAIQDESGNEVSNQSSDEDTRNNAEEQSPEATSSAGNGGNNRDNNSAESSMIASNPRQTGNNQFTRRLSAISPLNRQHAQLTLGFEENTADDSIVPSTPTLYVPRRLDGFSEAVSSPNVPSGGRFTFNESISAGVAQMVSEGMDDTTIDLSQLEEARNVQVAPTSPTVNESEVGQSEEEQIAILNVDNREEQNASQQENSEDVLLIDLSNQPDDIELDTLGNGSNPIDLIEDSSETSGQLEICEESNDGVSSEGQTDQSAGNTRTDEPEGREAEAAIEAPAQLTQFIRTINTARRSVRSITTVRGGGSRISVTWDGSTTPTQNITPRGGVTTRSGRGQDSGGRGSARSRGRRPRAWGSYNRF